MDEYIGTIQAFGFNYPPRYWEFCNGQLMSISENTALFALLSNIYGGDGRTTFALPDLRGRSIVHPGQGPGLTPLRWGQVGGDEDFMVLQSNMPAHIHTMNSAVVTTATTVNVGNGSGINEPDNATYPFGAGGSFPNVYSEEPPSSDFVGGVTSSSTITGVTEVAGAGPVPVSSRSPYLGIYMSICIEGYFPPRNN